MTGDLTDLGLTLLFTIVMTIGALFVVVMRARNG